MEKENINGIQVDVSAVLGDKIAEMAIATIPKERLEEVGKKAFNDIMFSTSDRWNNTEPSKASKIATEKYY
jgi:hypothetical protein